MTVPSGSRLACSSAPVAGYEDGHCYLPETELEVAKATELHVKRAELAGRCLEELVAEGRRRRRAASCGHVLGVPEETGRAIC